MEAEKLTVYGADLIINPTEYEFKDTIVIDCETDGTDAANFVGIGITDGPDSVYYFSSLDDRLRTALSTRKLVGHSIKGDAKWLVQWGCDIRPESLHMDTILMSYVQNTTKESHGLKDLAKSVLSREYPTYREIVGKGKRKLTLDQQPLEVVSAYCAADARCTYDLWKYFDSTLSPSDKKVLDTLEMPLMRILFEMEVCGIEVDRTYLKELQVKFTDESEQFERQLKILGLGNPRSPKQVLEWLKAIGIKVASTGKEVLEQHKAIPPIKTLLHYRESHKLLSTYVSPLLELSEKDGRIHTSFNQIVHNKSKDTDTGISTSRLSSSTPNLQNIPVRSEAGKLLRRAFIPDASSTLICADYEQIEYRLLAHFANDITLINAFKEGKDVHEETGRVIGADRKLGKTINFAAIYGAGPERISQTARISAKEAEKFLETYWQRLPAIKAWIKSTVDSAHRLGYVQTLYGRRIPIVGLDAWDRSTQMHAERTATNYVIQGSAAEIMKMAMIECRKTGYKPILTVHDEILFNSTDVNVDVDKIKFIMESVVSLKVPIVAKVGYGKNWEESK